MRDPFTPDFIETPIAPEPAAPVSPVQPVHPVPPFPHRPARSMAAAMLAAGLVVGSIGGGAVGALLPSHRTTATNTNANNGTVAAGVAAPAPSPGSFAAIYQQTKDSVVTITTSVSGGGARSFSQAEGAGIVVDTQGDILTNAHVVDGASQVQVAFSDGHTATGQVKGVDQSADLAVVQVSGSADQFHPLAAGHSGGALLDAQGKLIGINDSIQSPVEGNVGVGFAIPINRAESLLPSLEKGIAIQHPALGITAQTLTASTASQLGITGATSGVLVIAAAPGGPAAAAGLRGSGQADASDDIITAIDGHPIATVDELTQYLDTKKVGDRVTLSVIRNGQHISVGVTFGNFQPP